MGVLLETRSFRADGEYVRARIYSPIMRNRRGGGQAAESEQPDTKGCNRKDPGDLEWVGANGLARYAFKRVAGIKVYRSPCEDLSGKWSSPFLAVELRASNK